MTTTSLEPAGPVLDPARWDAVLARDAAHDGHFVYAVSSTGVSCRPSCPSRRPRAANVRFFARPVDAERAGFRSCRRCRPRELGTADPLAAVVRDACRQIEAADTPPSLEELARAAGLSQQHLQRAFRRLVGISPHAYAQGRRTERLRTALRAGNSVTAAQYEAGYGSGSRLYERAGERLGMTPGAYLRGAPGERIGFAVSPGPFGSVLVAATGRGVCAVRLGDQPELEAELAREFPGATLERDDVGLGPAVAAVVRSLDGGPVPDLPLDVRATAFRWRVWEVLRAIPRGQTRSYAQVAAAIGEPRAVRAVASACASNPVALLVPCHRVVRSDGTPGGYRWGPERKRALLDREAGSAG